MGAFVVLVEGGLEDALADEGRRADSKGLDGSISSCPRLHLDGGEGGEGRKGGWEGDGALLERKLAGRRRAVAEDGSVRSRPSTLTDSLAR